MTDTEENQHTLRPDFYPVVLSHNLEHWNLPGLIDKIETIETVWLLDRNVHVHCCELTPSYKMWPVEMPGDTPRHVCIHGYDDTDHPTLVGCTAVHSGRYKGLARGFSEYEGSPPIHSIRRVLAYADL